MDNRTSIARILVAFMVLASFAATPARAQGSGDLVSWLQNFDLQDWAKLNATILGGAGGGFAGFLTGVGLVCGFGVGGGILTVGACIVAGAVIGLIAGPALVDWLVDNFGNRAAAAAPEANSVAPPQAMSLMGVESNM